MDTCEKQYILSAENLSHSYRHVRALKNVSVRAEAGKITAIVGDNGSGKSTLIHILSGVLQPDAGQIRMGGSVFSGLTVKRALELGIRTVYQDLGLDDQKNAAENIFLGSELRKGPFLDRKAMLAQAEELLQSIRVDMPDLLAPVGSLSGGQRQAVAIARALRSPGQILLLDEPTAAMGVQESHRTLHILEELRARGMTQMIICHNLHQVFSIADYVYVLRAGEILAELPTAESSPEALQALILGQEAGL